MTKSLKLEFASTESDGMVAGAAHATGWLSLAVDDIAGSCVAPWLPPDLLPDDVCRTDSNAGVFEL